MSTDLYNAALKDAAESLGNWPELDAPDLRVELDNMFCGDRVRIDLAVTDDQITAVGCRAWGCLLTKAALAVLMGGLVGRSLDQRKTLEDQMAAFLRQASPEILTTLPAAEIFTPVQSHKSRQECVMLPFTALSNTDSSF